MAATPKKKTDALTGEEIDDDAPVEEPTYTAPDIESIKEGDEVTVLPGSSSSALPQGGTFTGTVQKVNDDGTLDIVVSFKFDTDIPAEEQPPVEPPVELTHVQPVSDSLTPETYGGHLYASAAPSASKPSTSKES